MATTLQTILDITRRQLNETTAKYWSDAELIALMNRGIRDLWRTINDNYQDYFFTTDTVTQAASATTLTSVASDVSIVRGLEPASLNTYPNLGYRPKPYNHPDFQTARASSAIDPTSGGTIWYWLVGAGAPVAAPTIYVAPAVTAEVSLTLTYVPTLTELTVSDDNPIPGESDNALVSWTLAYARAKERPERSPDPAWLGDYERERQKILVSLAPRQTAEEHVVEAAFELWWPS